MFVNAMLRRSGFSNWTFGNPKATFASWSSSLASHSSRFALSCCIGVRRCSSEDFFRPALLFVDESSILDPLELSAGHCTWLLPHSDHDGKFRLHFGMPQWPPTSPRTCCKSLPDMFRNAGADRFFECSSLPVPEPLSKSFAARRQDLAR